MPSTDQDYEQIKALQNQAKGLTQQAGEFEGGSLTFEADVMDKVRAARAERGIGNLAEDVANVTGRLATYRPQIEERMQGVNPLQVENIMGQQRGDLLAQLSRLASWGEQNEGTISEIIGAGANKMLAYAKKLQAEADAKQQEANSLLQIVQQKALEAQREFENQLAEKKFAEEVRQFGITSKKGTGGGTTTTDKAIKNYQNYIGEVQALMDAADANGLTKEQINKRLTLIAQKYQVDPQTAITAYWGQQPATKKTTSLDLGKAYTNFMTPIVDMLQGKSTSSPLAQSLSSSQLGLSNEDWKNIKLK